MSFGVTRLFSARRLVTVLRVFALLLVIASAAAVAESRAAPAAAEKPQTVLVRSDVAFAAAAARLRGSGGKICASARPLPPTRDWAALGEGS